MLEDRNRVYGIALALLSVLTGSAAPALVKFGVTANDHPLTLLMLRLWISVVIFWVFFALTNPGVFRIGRKTIIYTFAAGASNGIGLMLFYFAVKYLDAAIATMIFSFYPLFTVLLLALKGEYIQLSALLSLGLSLIGIYLLVGIKGGLNLVGVLMVMGTAFGYALHLNIIQWYLKDCPTQTTAIYIITFMTILITLVWLIGKVEFAPISAAGWISIVSTALLATVLTRLALFAAVRKLGSAQVSFFGPLDILLGVIWAVILLGEHLSVQQWLGGLMILAGMVWLIRTKKITTIRNN